MFFSAFSPVSRHLRGIVMSQVPSDRRVTIEPSGRVTLDIEKASLPPLPEVADEPALDETEPPAECMVVVLPLIVVEELTPPPPAVTEEDVPLELSPALE